MQARSEAETIAAEPSNLAAGRVRSFSTAATSGPTRLPPTHPALPPQQAPRQSTASEQLPAASSAAGGLLLPILGDNSEFADIIIQPSAFAAVASSGKDLPPAMPPAVEVPVESLPTVTSASAAQAARPHDADIPPAALAAGTQAEASQHAQSESLPTPERHLQPTPGKAPVLLPSTDLPGKHDGSLRHWIDGQATPPPQLPQQPKL